MTCDMQTWMGAYVLDALEPDETEALRTHIAGCSVCQDEVVSLSWIPALLRSVDLEGIERLGGTAQAEAEAETDVRPPPLMLDRLLASMHSANRTRRRRRPVALLFGAGAAATIVGAVTVAGGAFDTHRSPTHTVLQAIDPHSRAEAAVTLTGRTWGTELHLTLSWVAAGQECSLIAHSRDGRTDVAATWVASYKGTASVPGTTAIPADRLSELDVVTADGRQLVRIVVPHKTN
jgi:anti-sigma factor RsiW